LIKRRTINSEERIKKAIPLLKKGIAQEKLAEEIGVNPQRMASFLHRLNNRGHSIIRHQDMVRLERPGDFE